MAAITGCGSPGNNKTATFTPEKVHRLDSYAYRLGVMPDSTPETDKEAMTPGIAAIPETRRRHSRATANLLQ